MSQRLSPVLHKYRDWQNSHGIFSLICTNRTPEFALKRGIVHYKEQCLTCNVKFRNRTKNAIVWGCCGGCYQMSWFTRNVSCAWMQAWCYSPRGRKAKFSTPHYGLNCCVHACFFDACMPRQIVPFSRSLYHGVDILRFSDISLRYDSASRMCVTLSMHLACHMASTPFLWPVHSGIHIEDSLTSSKTATWFLQEGFLLFLPILLKSIIGRCASCIKF